MVQRHHSKRTSAKPASTISDYNHCHQKFENNSKLNVEMGLDYLVLEC